MENNNFTGYRKPEFLNCVDTEFKKFCSEEIIQGGKKELIVTEKKSIFTYKVGQTNNIMDYSHMKTFGAKRRIVLYSWQWKIINTNIK
jgi:hypothetical protein